MTFAPDVYENSVSINPIQVYLNTPIGSTISNSPNITQEVQQEQNLPTQQNTYNESIAFESESPDVVLTFERKPVFDIPIFMQDNTDISKEDMLKTFEKLEIKYDEKENVLICPTFRQDLESIADIA